MTPPGVSSVIKPTLASGKTAPIPVPIPLVLTVSARIPTFIQATLLSVQPISADIVQDEAPLGRRTHADPDELVGAGRLGTVVQAHFRCGPRRTR